MDVDVQILAWLALVASGISNIVTIWNFAQSPSRKNAEAIKALADSLSALIDTLDSRLDVAEKDVAELRLTVRQLPTVQEFHSLDRGIMELRGELRAFNERLGPIDNLSRRLQEVLLEKAK